MQRPLEGGAVTRGLATAGVKVVDRAFEELTQGEQGFELTPVIVEQGPESLTETAGAASWTLSLW